MDLVNNLIIIQRNNYNPLSVTTILKLSFSETALTCDESYDVAKALEKETEENVRKFGTSLLEINEHELQEFTQKHHSKKLTDWRLILKLIFLWEERKYQNNQSPYKQQLAQVLYQLGKKDLACKLDVMLINPQNNID